MELGSGLCSGLALLASGEACAPASAILGVCVTKQRININFSTSDEW